MYADIHTFTEVATHAHAAGWSYEKYSRYTRILTVTKEGKHVSVRFGATGNVARITSDGLTWKPSLETAKNVLAGEMNL